MNKTEKARPLVAQETGQAGKVLADCDSRNHCTPISVAGQIQISAFLNTGQESAVPLRYLKEMTGFDGRIVRLMIQRERLAGIPILADNQNSYFLPSTQEEKMRCVRSMRNRAREIEKSATAIERAEISQSLNAERREQAAATGQMRMEGV